MSNLKTMEVIAKFIGEKTGLTVHLEPGVHPHADPTTMQLWLPTDVVDEHIFPAVALAMHEAGHIKYTDFDAKQIVDNEEEFSILNAMEDARINTKIMQLLPNIRGFFVKLYELYQGQQRKGTDPAVMAICNCIMQYENFGQFKDISKEVSDLEYDIINDFFTGVRSIEYADYPAVKTCIKNIMQKLGLDKPPTPQPEPEPGQGNADGGDEEKAEERAGAEPGGSVEGGKGKSEGKVNRLEKLENMVQDCSVIKTDGAAKPYVPQQVDATALTEVTKARFEEMLKVKEEKLISTESGVLNTESLVSFFTEDLEELFSEVKIMTPKKSKIVLVLDASESMSIELWDSVSRHKAVIAAAKAIIESIEAVNKAEGICVEWEINGFTGEYIPFDKERWEKQYYPHGGTNILRAFHTAQDRLSLETDIEGNKIMIFITDGEVDGYQIEQMRESILRSGSSIKLVIVGVGADPTKDFVTSIVQDRNILAEGDAERVLFDAISVCLED